MKKIWITGLILFIAIFGVSAFILTKDKPSPELASAQTIDEGVKHEKIIEIAVEKNINGEITSGEVLITFEDPSTLPVYRETTLGVFLSREWNQLTLGTGSIEVEIGVEVINDEDPVKDINVSYTGDPINVLVTPDTEIYKDVTEIPEITAEDLETGEKLVMIEIQPGYLEDLEENMIIRVWGENSDGTVIANVLVYELVD